jgi:hypothetical protein
LLRTRAGEYGVPGIGAPAYVALKARSP